MRVRVGKARSVVGSCSARQAFAFDRSGTVLIIACPHALGLAIRLVTAISASMAARSGVLVKDRLALKAVCTVDAVLFDRLIGRSAVSARTGPL